MKRASERVRESTAQRCSDKARRGSHRRPDPSVAADGLFHHKGNLRLDPRLDETPIRDRTVVFESHVIKQDAAVGDVDVQRHLHRTAGKTNFPANQNAFSALWERILFFCCFYALPNYCTSLESRSPLL